MKRIESICAVGLLAVMALVGGCEKFFPKDDPVVDKAAPPKAAPAAVNEPAGKITRPVVVIDTSMGEITAELWDDSAPQTVKNFLGYVDDKHFDGLIFHRVMQGFMIQGGGFDQMMSEKTTRSPVKNEASVDKDNDRGTLAMARTTVVDSATSQFFINLVDNEGLNHRDSSSHGFGYCAFGKVTDGMDVVDEIAAVAVANAGGHESVPIKPVIIKSIRRKN
jgi:cyclophilin family peptidyl-prolyl cis-trans isomerase